jgi:hypothetical protein
MAVRWRVERLEWEDEELDAIELPKAPLRLRSGFGSGLSRRSGDPPGIVWAIGDRGPNLKVKDAVKLYGARGLDHLADVSGAKLMPRPDIGPELARLRVSGGRVELLSTLRIRDGEGRPVSGLPLPAGPHLLSEPAFDLEGRPLAPDPGGLDTEGVAALPDGGFWVSDEFGPSLARLDGEGRVLRRLVPQGVELDAPYPVEPCLPAIAAKRQLNRGFEALTLSPDGKSLFVAFQSPLAHPDEAAHEAARHVRIWKLDPATGTVEAQYLYPLDPPESFRRDREEGEFERKDIKVSEMLALGDEALLVLERGSHTTKIYRADIGRALAGEHLDARTRPTVEELSAGDDFPHPALDKLLLFSSDEAEEVGRDLEGMARLSPTELLLVSDNDFGVEGARTGFWKLSFEEPVLG